jgi:hypothetical protein
MHSVTFLKFHVDPFCPATFSPVVEIVQRVFEVESRPHFIGRAATPLHPILEGHIRRVFDPLGLLQRRTDDAATPTRDRRRAAALGRLLHDDRLTAGTSDFDGGGNPSAAPAYDRNIGLKA